MGTASHLHLAIVANPYSVTDRNRCVSMEAPLTTAPALRLANAARGSICGAIKILKGEESVPHNSGATGGEGVEGSASESRRRAVGDFGLSDVGLLLESRSKPPSNPLVHVLLRVAPECAIVAETARVHCNSGPPGQLSASLVDRRRQVLEMRRNLLRHPGRVGHVATSDDVCTASCEGAENGEVGAGAELGDGFPIRSTSRGLATDLIGQELMGNYNENQAAAEGSGIKDRGSF